MFRWALALFSAYFLLTFGVSAYSKTPYAALAAQIAHTSETQHQGPLATEPISILGAAMALAQPEPTESSPAERLFQSLVDDQADHVDLPDLQGVPLRLNTGASIRLRLLNQQLLPPHSPSLKRRPKPPRNTSALA